MSDKISEKELLYDPMFAKKPSNGWEDSEKGGIFGKAIVKKTIFILFLIVAIGSSLYFSFNALGKEKYSYTENETGYELSEFNGGEKDIILDVEFVQNENGKSDLSKPVTSVRNYAITCNEFIEMIYIGKDVRTLENNCFYYCTNLKAILVDPANEYFTSLDGVLYNKDMTEIIIHPIKNNEYRASLSMGIKAPSDKTECNTYLTAFGEMFGHDEEKRSDAVKSAIETVGANYVIPETVTKIADFCFNYCDKLVYIKIPDSVTEFGQMAFFKCASLESIYIPDNIISIGADALSYCEKLNYIFVPASVKTIGHHAFFGDLGCDKIYMGAKDDSEIKIGEGWLPKKSVKTLKNVEVVYGQTRRVN